MIGLKIEIYNKRGSEKPEEPVFQAKNTLNSGKGQQTNQKYRNLVNSDRQMQRLELKVNLERLTVRLGLTVILKKSEALDLRPAHSCRCLSWFL